MSSEHQAVPTGSTAETEKPVLTDSGEGRDMASGKAVEKSGIFSTVTKIFSGFGGEDEGPDAVKEEKLDEKETASHPTLPKEAVSQPSEAEAIKKEVISSPPPADTGATEITTSPEEAHSHPTPPALVSRDTAGTTTTYGSNGADDGASMIPLGKGGAQTPIAPLATHDEESSKQLGHGDSSAERATRDPTTAYTGTGSQHTRSTSSGSMSGKFPPEALRQAALHMFGPECFERRIEFTDSDVGTKTGQLEVEGVLESFPGIEDAVRSMGIEPIKKILIGAYGPSMQPASSSTDKSGNEDIGTGAFANRDGMSTSALPLDKHLEKGSSESTAALASHVGGESAPTGLPRGMSYKDISSETTEPKAGESTSAPAAEGAGDVLTEKEALATDPKNPEVGLRDGIHTTTASKSENPNLPPAPVRLNTTQREELGMIGGSSTDKPDESTSGATEGLNPAAADTHNTGEAGTGAGLDSYYGRGITEDRDVNAMHIGLKTNPDSSAPISKVPDPHTGTVDPEVEADGTPAKADATPEKTEEAVALAPAASETTKTETTPAVEDTTADAAPATAPAADTSGTPKKEPLAVRLRREVEERIRRARGGEYVPPQTTIASIGTGVALESSSTPSSPSKARESAVPAIAPTSPTKGTSGADLAEKAPMTASEAQPTVPSATTGTVKEEPSSTSGAVTTGGVPVDAIRETPAGEPDVGLAKTGSENGKPELVAVGHMPEGSSTVLGDESQVKRGDLIDSEGTKNEEDTSLKKVGSRDGKPVVVPEGVIDGKDSETRPGMTSNYSAIAVGTGGSPASPLARSGSLTGAGGSRMTEVGLAREPEDEPTAPASPTSPNTRTVNYDEFPRDSELNTYRRSGLFSGLFRRKSAKAKPTISSPTSPTGPAYGHKRTASEEVKAAAVDKPDERDGGLVGGSEVEKTATTGTVPSEKKGIDVAVGTDDRSMMGNGTAGGASAIGGTSLARTKSAATSSGTSSASSEAVVERQPTPEPEPEPEIDNRSITEIAATTPLPAPAYTAKTLARHEKERKKREHAEMVERERIRVETARLNKQERILNAYSGKMDFSKVPKPQRTKPFGRAMNRGPQENEAVQHIQPSSPTSPTSPITRARNGSASTPASPVTATSPTMPTSATATSGLARVASQDSASSEEGGPGPNGSSGPNLVAHPGYGPAQIAEQEAAAAAEAKANAPKGNRLSRVFSTKKGSSKGPGEVRTEQHIA